MNTEDKIAIICITENGKNLAFKINEKLPQSHIYLVKNKKNNLTNDSMNSNVFLIEKKVSELVGDLFNNYQYILFIMATGIVVRTIAPYIVNKFSDPAILVADEKGTNIISLLSGHMGGANEMTSYISKLIGANAVITTATDVNKKSSLDMISKRLNAYIDNFRENVKDVNAMLVNNQEIGIYIDGEYEVDTRGFNILNNIYESSTFEKVVIISNRNKINDVDLRNLEKNKFIKVVPRDIVLGIGCRRDTESKLLKDSLQEFLDKNNIDEKAIKLIGSIDVKKDEKAIIDLSKYLGVEFKIFSKGEISKVDYLYDKSEFVKANVGVYCVSEPVAHILSNGNLIIKKHKYKGITFSIGRLKL